MQKNELKSLVCAAIEAKREHIIRIAEDIYKNPELAFQEYKTGKLLVSELKKLGLPLRKNLALTGCRADLKCQGTGPTVAILGEMDALAMPGHPTADFVTGAAHACGHHAQCANMLGAAIGLTIPEVREALSGAVAFIAVPAEEHLNSAHYKNLKLKRTSGKQQMIHEGVFDDVNIAMMVHAGHDRFTITGFNGFSMKNVIFRGKASHAGLHPERGINALSMARLALSSIDFQRDTFRDDDSVRIHGIITKGGDAVNVTPARVELSLQIRARTPAAVQDASLKVDRSIQAAALAFGGAAEITTELGYLPFKSCRELEYLHEKNLHRLNPEARFICYGHRTSSTDMGDVSMIMPALHAYTGGSTGSPHQADFQVTDPELAYIEPSKLLAMNVIDLLYGDAATGAKVAAIPPVLTREQYLELTRDPVSKTEWSYL